MDYTKVSLHGYSQEVRIPKKFRLDCNKVKISKYGKGLLLEPVEEGFESLLSSLSMFTDDFMKEERKQPPLQKREELL